MILDDIQAGLPLSVVRERHDATCEDVYEVAQAAILEMHGKLTRKGKAGRRKTGKAMSAAERAARYRARHAASPKPEPRPQPQAEPEMSELDRLRKIGRR